MARVIPAVLSGWEPQPVRIDLGLAEVMFDLDPRWEDWSAPELVQT